jgi:hypothetical protein
MNYSRVFKESGRLLWRHKVLLALGLVLMVGSLPGLAGGHLYARLSLSFQIRLMNATGSGLNPDEFFGPIADSLFDPALLIVGTVGLFFLFLLIWMISTVGEAALIRGVADFDEGQTPSLGNLLSAGVRLLGRIIAIDTVIFLPIFLIVLLQMVLLGGGMIGGILLLTRPGSDPADLLPLGVIVGLALLILTVLLFPITIVTLLLRLIAFRSAVLEDLPTRPSIRRAWTIIRGRAAEIIVIFLLLYAAGYAVGMVISIPIIPFAFGGIFLFMAPVMQGQLPQPESLNSFLSLITLASILSILPNIVYRVFYSAVWTMAYREWQLKT